MSATSTTMSAGNELFVHNMRMLWRRDPELAARVDAVCDDERLPLEPTRSGAHTVRMATPGGPAVYLHSKYDPHSEAERLADTLEVEDRYCFVVSGLGWGTTCRRWRVGFAATRLYCVRSRRFRSLRLL